MRILILHNFYQHLGGEDIVVEQEARELIALGHEVLTLTTKNRKSINGIFQYGLYPYNCIIANQLLKQIEAYNPDIVHIHNLHYAIGPLIIRKIKKRGYPIVMTLHNFRLVCPSATLFYHNKIHTESVYEDFPWTAIKNKSLDNSLIKTFLTGFTYYLHKRIHTWQYVSNFIVMSEFNKRFFIQAQIGLAEDKTVIKRNFVTSLTVNPTNQRESHYLYVGRISEEKGIRQLVNLFRGKSYRLKIIGTGPIEEELKKETISAKNIEWMGQKQKQEVAYELSTCKAIIIPSVCFEGAAPLTLLEAISSKTPVLASDIGAIPEVIKHNLTGWLFDPYHKDSLFKAIEEFEQNNNVDEVIERAHQVYQSDYTKDVVVEKLINIYHQSIQENEHNSHRSS